MISTMSSDNLTPSNLMSEGGSSKSTRKTGIGNKKKKRKFPLAVVDTSKRCDISQISFTTSDLRFYQTVEEEDDEDSEYLRWRPNLCTQVAVWFMLAIMANSLRHQYYDLFMDDDQVNMNADSSQRVLVRGGSEDGARRQKGDYVYQKTATQLRAASVIYKEEQPDANPLDSALSEETVDPGPSDPLPDGVAEVTNVVQELEQSINSALITETSLPN